MGKKRKSATEKAHQGSYHLGRLIALLEVVGGNDTTECVSLAKVCPSAWLPKLQAIAARKLDEWRRTNRTLFDYYDRLIADAWLKVDKIPAVVTSPDDCEILHGYQRQRYSILYPAT